MRCNISYVDRIINESSVNHLVPSGMNLVKEAGSSFMVLFFGNIIYDMRPIFAYYVQNGNRVKRWSFSSKGEFLKAMS